MRNHLTGLNPSRASSLHTIEQGLKALLLMLTLIVMSLPIRAQEATDLPDDPRNHPWQAFVQENRNGADVVTLVDMLTGATLIREVTGERYTVFKRGLMYYDTSTRRVMVLAPSGESREHPFVQPNNYRVDWTISDDRTHIAWTVTDTTASGMLTTVTTVATIDGTAQRVVLRDGPRQDVRALPMAFSPDHSTLYLDLGHIDGLDRFTDFNLYAGVVGVDVESGEVIPLPDEAPANCLCGADVRQYRFGRLRLTDDLSGFDFYAYHLLAQTTSILPALALPNYTIGGDVLISPDGTRAVYALSRVNGFGTAEQTSQTVFVLANLETMTQTALTRAITTFVVPVEWTEDNSAVMLTSPLSSGTWKLDLVDGQVTRIANATYIGTL
ncbi:MAG: hypothetical protein OHK0046_29760 [Anaerolineae bacterium]